MGTKASPALLQQAGGFDAVVLALGAKPFIPGIPVEAGVNVFHAAEAFDGIHSAKQWAVIGGGAVAVNSPVYLQSLGKRVELVELRGSLLADML